MTDSAISALVNREASLPIFKRHLREVLNQIDQEPLSYAQDKVGQLDVSLQEHGEGVAQANPACRTPACIAGWAAYLGGEFFQPDPDDFMLDGEIRWDVTMYLANEYLQIKTVLRPNMYQVSWPLWVFDAAGLNPAEARRDQKNRFVPSAEEAVDILRTAISDRQEGESILDWMLTCYASPEPYL